LTEVNDEIDAITDERQREYDRHQTLVHHELDPAIQSIQGAYPIIEQFANAKEGAFVTLTSHTTNVFASMIDLGRGADMAEVLTVLVTVGAKYESVLVPAGDVEEIKRLFEALEADLVKARDLAIQEEQEKVKIFQATLAEWVAIREKLEGTEHSLVGYVSEM